MKSPEGFDVEDEIRGSALHAKAACLLAGHRIVSAGDFDDSELAGIVPEP